MNGCRIDFEDTQGALTDEEWKSVETIAKAFKDELTRKGLDAERIIKQMQLPDGQRSQAADSALTILQKMTDKEAKRLKRRADRLVRSESVYVGLKDRMEREAGELKLTRIDVLNAHLYNEVGGPGDNLELLTRTYQAGWIGRLDRTLSKITGGRFQKLARDRAFRLEVIRAYDLIHKGLPRQTKDDVIHDVAQALHRVRDEQRATLNQLGSRRAWQRSGLPMRWDWSRIQNARDEFIAILSDALDPKTHGDQVSREAIGRSIFDRLSESKGILDFDRLGQILGEDTAPVLEWTSGDAWINLNDRFGDDDFMRIARREIEHLATKEAIMRKFGPEADKTFNRLLRDAKKAGAAHSKVKRAEARYERMTKTFIPEQIRFSRYLGAARNLEVARKLGQAVWMALTDGPVSVYRMVMFHNAGIFDSVTRILSGLTKENRERAALLGTWAEGNRAFVANRMGVGSETLDDRLSKGTSTLADWTMTLSGLRWWTRWTKAGTTAVAEANLGRFIKNKTPYAALPTQLKAQLARHQIGEADWTAMKARHVRDDGRFDLFMLPRDDAGAALKAKVTHYLIDAVERGVLTPGMKEQEMLGLNQVPGRMGAELAKTFTQFASFALTAHNKIVRRTMKDQTISLKTKIAGLTVLMRFAMLTNVIRIQCKQALAGNNLYEWDDSELIQKAAMTLPYGLLVDSFMKIGGNRLVEAATGYKGYRGQSNVELFGPLMGEIQDALNGVSKIAKGNVRGGAGDLTEQLLQSVPGRNIWWAAAAYRAGIIDNALEWIDPQGQRETRKRAMRRAMQTRQGGTLRNSYGRFLD